MFRSRARQARHDRFYTVAFTQQYNTVSDWERNRRSAAQMIVVTMLLTVWLTDFLQWLFLLQCCCFFSCPTVFCDATVVWTDDCWLVGREPSLFVWFFAYYSASFILESTLSVSLYFAANVFLCVMCFFARFLHPHLREPLWCFLLIILLSDCWAELWILTGFIY